ncbi:MAG: PaaI family thioesterase [Clostridia bacterium]|nr:PaaI family thioesterase [Clostridia bacterium]
MERDYLAWAREVFAEDTYATQTTGIVIEDVAFEYAKCSLVLEKKHKNANDTVMGGAIYTLVDVTFAIAANSLQMPTVTLGANIEYLSAAPCTGKLTAEARCIKSGKNICRFEINVYHNESKLIASARMNGYRK